MAAAPSNSSSASANPVSRKRSSKDAGLTSKSEPPAKRVFPIFGKSSDILPQDEPSGPFRWRRLPSLTASCLYGENSAPEIRTKIAAFDLDGTVIKWSSFNNGSQWEYWNKKVPQALKQAHESGYTVVFFSNQCLHEKKLVQWKQKIPSIAKALHDVPFVIFAATAKDVYRKPMPGMWVALEKLALEAGITIDKAQSFFVGDAAGRKADFSGTDRKFALNLNLQFYTPEEYFLHQAPEVYTLQGSHVSSLLPTEIPRITPTSSPILPMASKKQAEIVIFVGSPASGKTTYYESVFLPAGYVHVNQDKLGSRAKCMKTAEEYVKKGVSCVIDNTNRDKKTRQHYLDLAKTLDVPIRCFWFKSSPELAWHNNLYRAFCLPLLAETTTAVAKSDRKLIPYTAFLSFAQGFEEPSVHEGFHDVKTVNWIFEGDSSKERFWKMWLQIDGK
ncbi:PNK3P-domain-containing protein [Phellopilus nigrolimitatus]|nr:PNK3P-domain-containing protein [Phellopilus nigrolimitatus]